MRVVERARQQSEIDHRRISARHVHLRHRRVGRRQIHAGGRHAVQGGGAAADGLGRGARAARADRGAGTARQDHRHRPVADRPHAAFQSRHLHRPVRADPRLVRRTAGITRARLQAGPVQLQREGRALRGVPGRRRAEDRDALPARRLCHLRHVQGPALQSRDAGNKVPRQVDRRGAGDDGGRGGAVFQRADPHPRPAAASCSRSGSAISRWASRRPRCRAARRSGSSCRRNWRGARRGARCTSSTNPRPGCISRTCASCWRCCTRWSTRATRWW